MTRRTISAAKLRALGACHTQVEKFREIFGSAEVEPTLEICVEYAAVFRWDWAAENLLSPKAREAYDAAIATAREAYKAATAPAWEAYDAAIATARKAYKAAIAPALEAYKAAIAPALEAYDAAIATARKAREAAIAPAWFAAWQMDA